MEKGVFAVMSPLLHCSLGQRTLLLIPLQFVFTMSCFASVAELASRRTRECKMDATGGLCPFQGT